VLGKCSWYCKCAVRYLGINLPGEHNIDNGLNWVVKASRSSAFFHDYAKKEENQYDPDEEHFLKLTFEPCRFPRTLFHLQERKANAKKEAAKYQ
jgi:hypothetical protein